MARFFFLLFLFCPFLLKGQAAPAFVPDDFVFDVEDIGCICSPGVINKSPGKGLLMEYSLTSGGDFTPDEVASGISPSKVTGLDRIRFRLKIPLIVKPKTKILVGLDHFQEKYNFDFVQPVFAPKLNLVNGHFLKSSRISLYFLRSISEKEYLGIRARVTYNGDYSGIINTDSYYRQIKISGIWGMKKREDKEWGIGIFYSDNFTKKTILPFFLYNHTFNERWGIEAAFPISALMRYNFNPRSLLLFGPELSSASYALRGSDLTFNEDYYFKHTELLIGAKYERELLPWIWGNIHTGLQINFDSEYKNTADSSDLFEPDLKTGVFLRIGLFLSPPKR